MSAAAPASFWAIAIAGSLALHGAIGMGLYAMPLPEPKQPTHTEITISVPEIDARMQRAKPEAIAARASEEAPEIAQPAGPALAANESTELAAQHQPAAVDAQTAPDSIELEQARLAEVVASNDATETVAAATNAQIAANQIDTDQILAEAVPETVLPLVRDAEVAPSSGVSVPGVTAVTDVAEPVGDTQTPVGSPTPPANSMPVAITPPANAMPATIGVAKPSAEPEQTVMVLSPAKPAAVAPTTDDSNTPATVTEPQAVSGSEVIASSALPEATAPKPVEKDEPIVAMLQPQNIAPDEDLAVPDSGGMRIEDFLSESEGSDCLLALPLDPMQASVEAYAAMPESVRELGAEYMRVAGLNLKTEMRPVSNAQCGALRFARSLAQYPNFPLQLVLNQPEIASGTELSGVVSGLRKDTLYLMVVDDEGKAELVSSSAVGDVRSISFSAPLTLTGRPGSAVQLLIAIASDGPLRNLPTKPGMPASEYFSKLTFEIIGDNRPIAYGITSFVVR